MVEVGLVHVLKAVLLAAVKTSGELDGGAAAGAKVVVGLTAGDGGAAGALDAVGRAALVLLGIALLGAALDLARVGSVGARVLLDGARALDGSTGVQEGRAVDTERTVGTSGALNRGRGAAEGATEGLNVDGSSGATRGSTSTSSGTSSGASAGITSGSTTRSSTSISTGVAGTRVTCYSGISLEDPFYWRVVLTYQHHQQQHQRQQRYRRRPR